ncbi:hypothetical protein [Moraxella lacunata]|uniref:Uncharacterized protein n=1 Tax=Moraxella lacunata TaxID=477 RepID=A0A1V4GYL8_MORLA|nr:hypothetical protein [Moraxella lacunata]OPH37725.1 hypothetical protein B5J94_05040 [Moraxella lacunata]
MTVNVYLGIPSNFPNIEFQVKFPEILYPAWSYNSGFSELIKSLPNNKITNIVSNSTDFLKFISIQESFGTQIKIFSIEFDDNKEILSNNIIEYTNDIDKIKMIMLQDYILGHYTVI